MKIAMRHAHLKKRVLVANAANVLAIHVAADRLAQKSS